MKIAIPVLEDKGSDSIISEHFGHSPFFAFIELDEEKETIKIEKNPLSEHSPGELPLYLKERGVNLIIVRGIGQRAIFFFEKLGINVIRGAEGSIEDIIKKLKNNLLKDRDYKVKEKLHKH